MNRIMHTIRVLLALVLFPVTQFTVAQTNWIKSPDNPILTPGTGWMSHGFPFIYLLNLDDTLRMWFTASDGNPVSYDRIGYATSTDGLNFAFSETPVLEPSTSGNTFDSEGVFGASVLYDGTLYRMWYNGYNTQPYYTGQLRVGLATSNDGKHWSRYSADPILPLGPADSWDAVWAYVNTVIYEDNIYKMCYTGFDGLYNRVGYATSPDGITWTKYANNPVIELGGSGMGFLTAAQNARVIHDDSGYKMWFNGQNSSEYFNVHYGVSEDGVTWDYNIWPHLSTGPTGSFDELWVWAPCVIKQDDVYRMWYTGYDGSTYSVGYATDSVSTAIEESEHFASQGSSLVSLLPNPASSEVLVSYNLNRAAVVKIRIVNSYGQVVLNINEIDGNCGLNTKKFNTAGLKAGLYWVQLYGYGISSCKELAIIK